MAGLASTVVLPLASCDVSRWEAIGERDRQRRAANDNVAQLTPLERFDRETLDGPGLLPGAALFMRPFSCDRGERGTKSTSVGGKIAPNIAVDVQCKQAARQPDWLLDGKASCQARIVTFL